MIPFVVVLHVLSKSRYSKRLIKVKIDKISERVLNISLELSPKKLINQPESANNSLDSILPKLHSRRIPHISQRRELRYPQDLHFSYIQYTFDVFVHGPLISN